MHEMEGIKNIMKMLIVSQEVWRNDQNGGNTLTWMFSGFPSDTEFAQVYCSEGIPNNNVCSNYFKLSTSDVAKAIKMRSKEAGTLVYIEEKKNEPQKISGTNIVSKIKGLRIARDAVWKTGYYKSESLKRFILDFNPDIIYAPGYGVNYMNYLIQWIKSFVSSPIISLVSDDFYSFHQRRINPFFWCYLLTLRKNFRKTVSEYELIYTMTEIQKIQLEKDFVGTPVKIIQKGYKFDDEMVAEKKISKPIRILHVGNLYFNRWKTLCLLADEINAFNKDEEKYVLEIVTSYHLSNTIREQLESRNVKIHLNISEKELKELYKSCNIVVHVEGFDIINRLRTRMSFSTKIIEYLASGCAILVICDSRQSTFQYLVKNDLAFFADSKSKIADILARIYDDRELVEKYRKKAYIYGKDKHSIEKVTSTLYNDFMYYIRES